MLAIGCALLCRAMLVCACGSLLGGVAFVCYRVPNLFLIVAIAGIFLFGRARFGSGWHHGTAKLAGWHELADGMLDDVGHAIGTTSYMAPPSKRFAIGQLLSAPLHRSVLAVRLFLASVGGPSWGGTNVIRVNDAVHLAAFSKTGGGKGVSVVLPTLLSHQGSTVVTDPKSENVRLSGRHRERAFHHRIIRLEPFGKDSDTYNPMDGIDHHTSPYFINQCNDLAAALVVRTGKETESAHWLDSAERVLTGFIAFVAATATDPDLRNLQSVRALLASREKYNRVGQLMRESGDVAGGMLQLYGESLKWHVEREEASVMSTVQRHLNFLDSPLIAANVMRSSFNPRELRTGRMTIYLCLPPERLKTLAPLQRMWLSSILGAITPGADERVKTLFLLDEVANLGRFPILEDAVTVYRGMGIRLWYIFQSLGQVKECFGDGAGTFLDNVGTQLYFGIQSFDTAEALSKRIGAATVTAVSDQSGSSRSRPEHASYSGKESGSSSTSKNRTFSEIARKLLLPEEILTLPSDMCILFHNNRPPILAKLIKYYKSPLFFSPFLRRPRTGRSPGLGLRELVLSASLLVCSVSVATVATALPSLRFSRPRPAGAAMQPRPALRQKAIGTLPIPVGGMPRGYRPLSPASPTYGGLGGKVGYSR